MTPPCLVEIYAGFNTPKSCTRFQNRKSINFSDFIEIVTSLVTVVAIDGMGNNLGIEMTVLS